MFSDRDGRVGLITIGRCLVPSALSSARSRSTRTVSAGLSSILLLAACTGPISTSRSPYHQRMVEIRNATNRPQTLKIEPAASQHLVAATTFTGLLKPGEAKSLYVYHGFAYVFRVLDEWGLEEIAETIMQADRDLAFVFAGDSLGPEVSLTALLGEPKSTFADSL